jgi:hypothetical protein
LISTVVASLAFFSVIVSLFIFLAVTRDTSYLSLVFA